MQNIVTEFIQTERVYCNFLELTLEYFFKIVPTSGIKDNASLQLFNSLKTNWQQLLQFHTSFLLTLETRCLVDGGNAGGQITESGSFSVVAMPSANATTPTELILKKNAAQGLANVVIKLSPYFKLYSGYCRMYPLIIPIFELAQENSSEFQAAVKHFEGLPQAKNLSLGSILVKPVQRVCKYELFLRDLQRKVPRNNVGLLTDVVKAYSATQSVVAKVNETGKTGEQLAKLAELQEQLRPQGKVNILQSHRRLDLKGNAMAVQMLPSGSGGGRSSSSHSSRGSSVVLVDDGAHAPEATKEDDGTEVLNQPLSLTSAEPVHIFLVSDVLLVCRYKFKKKGVFRSSDKHRYHVAHQIPLTAARVSPVNGSSGGGATTGGEGGGGGGGGGPSLSERGVGTSALELMSERGKEAPWFVLSFATVNDCDKWMQHICLAIDLIKSKETHRRISVQNSRSSPMQGSSPDVRRRSGSGHSGGSGGNGGSGGRNRPARGRTQSANSMRSTGSTGSSTGSSSSNGRQIFTQGFEEQSPNDQGGGDTQGDVVHCPHCHEVLGVPTSAHVMKCHFCNRVFLHRPGRMVGKPVFNDGCLGVVSKSGLFGG